MGLFSWLSSGVSYTSSVVKSSFDYVSSTGSSVFSLFTFGMFSKKAGEEKKEDSVVSEKVVVPKVEKSDSAKFIDAVSVGDTEAVKNLLDQIQEPVQKGCLVIHSVDGSGNSPVHIAAANLNEGMLKLLLANKANANAKNPYGETPVDIVNQIKGDIQEGKENAGSKKQIAEEIIGLLKVVGGVNHHAISLLEPKEQKVDVGLEEVKKLMFGQNENGSYSMVTGDVAKAQTGCKWLELTGDSASVNASGDLLIEAQ